MHWLIVISVFFISFFLTGLLRRYAVSHELVDVPNHRSSHSVPTPRGGGLSIVLVCLVAIVVLGLTRFLTVSWSVGIAVAVTWIALIGFLDDHKHIAARWRLLNHFGASILLVYSLGGLPDLVFFDTVINLGWLGDVLAVVTIVWLINLYNFMDGIDGIAGVEALSSSLVAGLIFLFLIDQPGLAILNLIMAAAVTGFLVWNFPPAKIFLGDVGSGFLGIMLGALALASTHVAPQMLWVWLILLGVFIVDSTYTLAYRLFAGDQLFKAHCNHAYQCAARRYNSHLAVSIAVLLINAAWLTPWAVLVALNWIDGLTATILSYIPLLLITRRFSAGRT